MLQVLPIQRLAPVSDGREALFLLDSSWETNEPILPYLTSEDNRELYASALAKGIQDIDTELSEAGQTGFHLLHLPGSSNPSVQENLRIFNWERYSAIGFPNFLPGRWPARLRSSYSEGQRLDDGAFRNPTMQALMIALERRPGHVVLGSMPPTLSENQHDILASERDASRLRVAGKLSTFHILMAQLLNPNRNPER